MLLYSLFYLCCLPIVYSRKDTLPSYNLPWIDLFYVHNSLYQKFDCFLKIFKKKQKKERDCGTTEYKQPMDHFSDRDKFRFGEEGQVCWNRPGDTWADKVLDGVDLDLSL